MNKLTYPRSNRADYLSTHASVLDVASIEALRRKRDPWLSQQMRGFNDFLKTLEQASELQVPTSEVRYHQGQLYIDRPGAAPAKSDKAVIQLLESLKPWKKGPFHVWGHHIDSEWRSDFKWQRIVDGTDLHLQGQRVADVGCGNGYYMYRMLEHNPELIVGFDPNLRYWLQFELLNALTSENCLHFERLGGEHLTFYPKFFDTIFCLGVLYHHTDPVAMLRTLRDSLTTGGVLIAECQGIPGEDPIALCPKNRYANASGIWLLPTQSCLTHWLHRAGFRDINCFFAAPLSTNEQRRSSWADIASLEDFLSPEDPSKTIEGYPAPWRIYMSAKK